MRRLLFVFLMTVLLWVTTGLRFAHASTITALPPNFLPDLVEKVADGVVNISSTKYVQRTVMRGLPEFFGMMGVPETRTEKQSALGSGFLIDKNGYILTNNHVIEGADEVVAVFRDQRKIPAKIVGRDKLLDLALLQLKGGATVANLKPLELASSEKVRLAESVFAIGNPFGLQHTVTSGIISGKNRTVGIGPLDNFLQTDASINFGNSGGPLFNLKGEVIGVNTAIHAQAQLLGFAIPIDEAKAAVSDLKRYGYVVRAWLGVLGTTMTPAIQYYNKLAVDTGVVIENIIRKSPAQKLGLDAGDVITSYNGKEVKVMGDLQKALALTKPKDKVTIKFNRRGKTISKDFVAEPAPDLTEAGEEVL